MDWGSLIGAGASALGGLLGGGEKETSTTQSTSLSPELKAQIEQIFAKIPQIFNKSYPQYQGQRTAGPTASRTQMDQFIAPMQQQMMQRMTQPNQYQQRINQVLDQTPAQISVPDLLGRTGNAGVVNYGGYETNQPTRLTQQQYPTWMQGQG